MTEKPIRIPIARPWMGELEAEAIRRGVMCAHREPAYSELVGPLSLPESESAQDHCILLPIFHQMTEDEQVYVAKILEEACRKS
jgi:perosamine synthetase